MPTITSDRLEGLADTNPEIYEVLRDVVNQLNQVLPTIIAGNGHPEIIAGIQDPSASSVPAAPGTIYLQRNAQAGPLVIHVKDANFDSSGWAELGAFGSIPPSSGTGFQAVATATTVTFYYDGTNGSQIITVQRANGQSSQVAAGKTVVTGLLANTTYYFYPYYDERTQSLRWVAGTVGNAAIGFTAQDPAAAAQQRLTNRIPLAAGTPITVTTPSGGSSPSSVGGGFGGKGRFA